jgi:hypothetical protein
LIGPAAAILGARPWWATTLGVDHAHSWVDDLSRYLAQTEAVSALRNQIAETDASQRGELDSGIRRSRLPDVGGNVQSLAMSAAPRDRQQACRCPLTSALQIPKVADDTQAGASARRTR